MASQDKVQDVTQKKDEVRKRQAVETAEVEQEMISAEQADLATLQRAVANPGGVSAGDVSAIQRTVGNRAAAKLLAGQSPQVQAKLVVGPAGDKFERQADEVARQVVNMVPESSQTPAVQRQEEEEDWAAYFSMIGVQEKREVSSDPPIVQRSIFGNFKFPTFPNLDFFNLFSGGGGGPAPMPILEWIRTAGLGQIDSGSSIPSANVRIGRQEPGIPGVAASSEVVWMKADPTASDSSLQRLSGWGTVADEEGLLEDHSFEVSVDLETRLKELAGLGTTLPEALQKEMEGAFKADFSQVVIHADSAADELCQALSAQAFTYGYDIYFANDKYKPWSVSGKELIAHELTHVVQQTGYGPQADQPDSESAA